MRRAVVQKDPLHGKGVVMLLMRLLSYTLRAVARNGNARDAGSTRHRGEATVDWW